MKTLYQVITVVIRMGTNVLAVPIWWGIVSSLLGLFAGGMWSGFIEGFTTGWNWSFGTTTGLIVSALFAVLGMIHGIKLAKAESYFGTGGFLAFLWDHLWSLPNTIVGSVFALITVTGGIDKSMSKGTGRLVLVDRIFSDFDTTFGNVTAGNDPTISDHEALHVWQARLFGLFLYPLWFINYVINTIVPWWIFLLKDKPADFGKYFVCGVYPYTVFELWAYTVGGTKPSCK